MSVDKNGKKVGYYIGGWGFEPQISQTSKCPITIKAKHLLENLTTKKIYIVKNTASGRIGSNPIF